MRPLIGYPCDVIDTNRKSCPSALLTGPSTADQGRTFSFVFTLKAFQNPFRAI